MSGPFFFGVSTVKPSRAAAKVMREAARTHGARFIEADTPEGYRRWFEAPNLGAPFDRDAEAAVYQEISRRIKVVRDEE